MSKAKSNYYTSVISENLTDQCSLWKAFNKVLHRHPVRLLPECPFLKQLAENFGCYFSNKISLIRSSFPSSVFPNSVDSATAAPSLHKLSQFTPVSDSEVERLIMRAPVKSCDLGPIPTRLLKSCVDSLLPPITKLINLSLSSGTFPPAFKFAHVSPLLKKPSVGKEDLKNYRPGSNLSFISKLIEKVAASQIGSFLESTNKSNNFQSAYKQLHSTETALLKIRNDILTAMDSGKVTALTLLDLSAAFDTMDHSILLQRLEMWYSFGGVVISWLRSYLADRFQSVKLDHCLSKNVTLPFGVPQGSVLGPLLFSLYTGPLSCVIASQSVPHHLYADDTQLYISFSADNSESSFHRLQQCLVSVQDWMTTNKLKLNPNKTEFLLIGHKRQRLKYLSMFPVTLLGSETHPSKTVRNLGIVFDENFNFRTHINNVCKLLYYHIRDLRGIRRHLNLDQAKCLASALVSSQLDYCNSLLHGVAVRDMLNLQWVQNCLARVVTRVGRFAPSTPLRNSLYWLPISFRIQFKILTLTYKTLSSGKPSYLADLIHLATPNRNLRFNKGLLLSTPKCKTKTRTRVFSVCAPSLWNKLPLSIHSSESLTCFHQRLKTHLFGLAYPP